MRESGHAEHQFLKRVPSCRCTRWLHLHDVEGTRIALRTRLAQDLNVSIPSASPPLVLNKVFSFADDDLPPPPFDLSFLSPSPGRASLHAQARDHERLKSSDVHRCLQICRGRACWTRQMGLVPR